jgi:hypothetical protein
MIDIHKWKVDTLYPLVASRSRNSDLDDDDGTDATTLTLPRSSEGTWSICMLPKELLLLVLGTLTWCTGTTTATQTEQFNELLTLRPLRDGRVASRFSFIISQKDVEPRDLSQGSKDDDRERCVA